MATPSVDDALFDAFATMRAGWPTRGWSWDSRLSCVTSSFSAEFVEQARAAMRSALTMEWTSSTVAKAPAPLRDAAERAGGLRSGQLLLGGGQPGGHIAYGLWWPWGDAFTISLRVGLVGVDPEREPFQRLRDVFGVSIY